MTTKGALAIAKVLAKLGRVRRLPQWKSRTWQLSNRKLCWKSCSALQYQIASSKIRINTVAAPSAPIAIQILPTIITITTAITRTVQIQTTTKVLTRAATPPERTHRAPMSTQTRFPAQRRMSRLAQAKTQQHKLQILMFNKLLQQFLSQSQQEVRIKRRGIGRRKIKAKPAKTKMAVRPARVTEKPMMTLPSRMAKEKMATLRRPNVSVKLAIRRTRRLKERCKNSATKWKRYSASRSSRPKSCQMRHDMINI